MRAATNLPPDIVVPCPIVNYPTPVATCPRVTVTYEVTATDTCGVTSITCHGITRSFSPPAPIAVATFTMDFPVGMTLLTCTAMEQSGNTASCSFVVTVTSGVSNTIQPETIRVKKVYDWVVFQSNFRLILDLNNRYEDPGNQK